jgi:hypothetical protein
MPQPENPVTKRVPETGLAPRDILLSYDGLGFLRAIADGTLPQPPITELLGFRLIGVEHGNAVFEGHPNSTLNQLFPKARLTRRSN